MTAVSAPHFTDDTAAREYLEPIRWPNGPACPHCKENHLHRYLSEFDFPYNNRTALGANDAERAREALNGIEGKHLTYR